MQPGLIQNLSGSFTLQYQPKLFAAQVGLEWLKCGAVIAPAAMMKRTGFIEEK